MTLYNLEAIAQLLTPAETLAVLAGALGAQTHRFDARARATADRKHPEEGLSLLKAYVAIDDRKVRQAILDLVVAISERDVRACPEAQ